MVNSDNRIEGRSITEHPLGDAASLYTKDGLIRMAAQAQIGGVITIEAYGGEQRFQAGDWIVSNVPPTTAWREQDQTFRLTYVPYVAPAAETAPKAPVTAPTVAKKPVVRRKKPVRRVTKPKTAVEKPAVASSDSLEALI